MIIPNAAPAWGKPSNDPVQPLHKRTMTVIAMLALTTTFIFAAAPAAIAAPVSTNNHMSYAAGGPNNHCGERHDSKRCDHVPPGCWPFWICDSGHAHHGRGDRTAS